MDELTNDPILLHRINIEVRYALASGRNKGQRSIAIETEVKQRTVAAPIGNSDIVGKLYQAVCVVQNLKAGQPPEPMGRYLAGLLHIFTICDFHLEWSGSQDEDDDHLNSFCIRVDDQPRQYYTLGMDDLDELTDAEYMEFYKYVAEYVVSKAPEHWSELYQYFDFLKAPADGKKLDPDLRMVVIRTKAWAVQHYHRVHQEATAASTVLLATTYVRDLIVNLDDLPLPSWVREHIDSAINPHHPMYQLLVPLLGLAFPENVDQSEVGAQVHKLIFEAYQSGSFKHEPARRLKDAVNAAVTQATGLLATANKRRDDADAEYRAAY